MGKKRKPHTPKNKKKEVPAKKPLIDPELLKDIVLKDVFRFPNGDVYVGEFSLTIEGKVFRHGRGKYFVADGSCLVGQWENDVLLEAEKLSSPDGSWYTGSLEDGTYSGPGVLGHPGVGILECDFHQGQPTGRVTLTDRDNNKWEGQVTSSLSAKLLPRNHFFDTEEKLLQQRRGSDKPARTSRKTIDSNVSRKKSSFEKTMKTAHKYRDRGEST